jgi:activator of HSP90 ATPase
MTKDFKVSAVFQRSPQELYDAWLDSKQHSNMTGAKAKISKNVGETFHAWDGYISGKNLILESGKLIVQAWRTSEFSEDEGDSQIEITFEPVKDGTKLVLRHTKLPPHGEIYEQGWEDSYFEPMRAYFKVI